MAVVGILAAAGRGERLGTDVPKAFALCAGRPLLEWSLEVLESACDRVVVAVPPDRTGAPDRVAGGDSRSESVRAALRAAPEARIAVVHDAARPLVTRELVEACVAAARVSDTIKEAGADERVTRTLDRGMLWAVQTPQAFGADALRKALEEADDTTLAAATDDASLVEAAGGSVRVVEALPDNIKVTSELDLRVAEALLRARAAC